MLGGLVTDPLACCHDSHELHLTEAALLATLLVEHDLLTAMVDHPAIAGLGILDLLDAHRDAAAALVAWKTAGAGL
jgi:hypothetical protein